MILHSRVVQQNRACVSDIKRNQCPLGKYGSFHETAEVVNSLQVSNRRYDEMQADFALVPLTISGMSQEEAL